MNPARVARFLVRLLNIVVLGVSGTYVIVYLYRWEWNRAVISGIFFLAAEIALIGSLVLDGLRRSPVSVTRAGPGSTITAANRDRRRQPFGWLEDGDRAGVFIPVLLGAGAILSAVAYAVERLAGAVAGPSVDRHTAGLIDLDLPMSASPANVPPGPHAPAATLPGRLLGWVVATVTATLLLVAAIDVIADATQSRTAGREPTTGAMTVVLSVRTYGADRRATAVIESLWMACRLTARTTDLRSVAARPDGTVEILITPAMGDLRRRRLFGCLEDATLDQVSVGIVGWSQR